MREPFFVSFSVSRSSTAPNPQAHESILITYSLAPQLLVLVKSKLLGYKFTFVWRPPFSISHFFCCGDEKVKNAEDVCVCLRIGKSCCRAAQRQRAKSASDNSLTKEK